MLMKRFEGQTAIISGGAGDIGHAIAVGLAREGANIAVGDIRPSAEAEPIVRELSSFGVKVAYTQVDVANAADVDRWVAATHASLGAPRIAIVNAAIVTVKDLLEFSPESWGKELDVNLSGGFYLAQSAAIRMVAAKSRGAIVFVGSWAAHAPHVNLPAYSVAKAGIRMLTRLFALRLAPLGIVVNEVAPGFVDAGLSGRAFAKDPELKRSAAAQAPVKSLILAEDVAVQVLHLCDPANRHVTGATLLIDGGLSLNSGAESISAEKRRSDG